MTRSPFDRSHRVRARARLLWSRGGSTAAQIASRVGRSESQVRRYVKGLPAQPSKMLPEAVVDATTLTASDESRSTGRHQALFFPRLERALDHFTRPGQSVGELADTTMALRAINSLLTKHLQLATDSLAARYAQDAPLVFTEDGTVLVSEDISANAEQVSERAWKLKSSEVDDHKSIENKLWNGLRRQCAKAAETDPAAVLRAFRTYAGATYRNRALDRHFGAVSDFYASNLQGDLGFRPVEAADGAALDLNLKATKNAWREHARHAEGVLGIGPDSHQRGVSAAVNPRRARKDRLAQFGRMLADSETVRNAVAENEGLLAEFAAPGDVICNAVGAPLFMTTTDVHRSGPKHDEFDRAFAKRLPVDAPVKESLAVIREIVAPRWKKPAAKALTGATAPQRRTNSAKRVNLDT